MKFLKKSILLGWQQQSSVKSNSFSLEMMSKRRSLHFCEKIRWASLARARDAAAAGGASATYS